MESLISGNFKAVEKTTKDTLFHAIIRFLGWERSMPHQEQSASKLIKEFFKRLPRGGISVFIGTPTPFAVARAFISKHSGILIDNLLIALEMMSLSDRLFIIVGNAKDNKKGWSKGEVWSRIEYLRNAKVYVGPVTGPTFRHEINRLCLNNPLEVIKVVLMTSGHFEGTGKKEFNFDVNFKDPIIDLSQQYNNLHIITMKRVASQFIPVYFRDGKETVIK
jgi:hypothetical protein